MLQPTDSPKHQLCPAKDRPTYLKNGRNGPDPDSITSSDKSRTLGKGRLRLTSALRLRVKDDQVPIKRREMSITDIGAITTVQGLRMDSPTIPNRPPVYRRSSSAPGNNWHHSVFGQDILKSPPGPAYKESGKASDPNTADSHRSTTPPLHRKSRFILRQPLPLEPLASPDINTSADPLPHFAKKDLDCGKSTGPRVPPKSPRIIHSSCEQRASCEEIGPEVPPKPIQNDLRQQSSSASIVAKFNDSYSMEEMPLSLSQQMGPISAPSHSGSTTWTAFRNHSGDCPPKTSNCISSQLCGTLQDATLNVDHGGLTSYSDALSSNRKQSKPTSKPIDGDDNCFDALPEGIYPAEASKCLSNDQIEVLKKQAIGQASRFSVLRSKDVDYLARELHGLDERSEFLRTTLQNLSDGQRNLQERICLCLRSPHLAKLSYKSLLKQEEVVSQLSSSIQDWTLKHDMVENRRLRVRQKLLEHIAAALLLQSQASTEKRNDSEKPIYTQFRDQCTSPYKSPTNMSSPLPQVLPVGCSQEPDARGNVESIQVFADSELVALLADVQDKIDRMRGESKKNMTEAW